MMMHGYWFGSFGWIGMIVGAVIWLLVIGGLVWFLVWAIRRPGNTVSHQANVSAGVSAKEIVQERYARGEINREEYQQLLDDLSH